MCLPKQRILFTSFLLHIAKERNISVTISLLGIHTHGCCSPHSFCLSPATPAMYKIYIYQMKWYILFYRCFQMLSVVFVQQYSRLRSLQSIASTHIFASYRRVDGNIRTAAWMSESFACIWSNESNWYESKQRCCGCSGAVHDVFR